MQKISNLTKLTLWKSLWLERQMPCIGQIGNLWVLTSFTFSQLFTVLLLRRKILRKELRDWNTTYPIITTCGEKSIRTRNMKKSNCILYCALPHTSNCFYLCRVKEVRIGVAVQLDPMWVDSFFYIIIILLINMTVWRPDLFQLGKWENMLRHWGWMYMREGYPTTSTRYPKLNNALLRENA